MERGSTAGDIRLSLRIRGTLRRWSRLRRARNASIKERADDPIVTAKPARIGLAAGICLYVALFCYWTLRNHYGFATSGFDLGIFEQGVWLLSRFEDPFVTVLGLDLFGDHTNFFMLLLVPFYWVAPSAGVLLVAQTVALGAAALPAFLIAREKLRDEWFALVIALVYLIHPATGWTNFENFHPDSFEVPLAFTAIFLMLRKRWTWFFVSIVLLLAVKEDAPLLTFGLGAYVAARHNRNVGLATCALSVAYFFSAVWLILPAFNDVGTLDAWRIPSERFGGGAGLLKAIFTRPWDVAAIALEDEKPLYVLQLLAPLAFLSLAGGWIFLVAAGPLLSNLMSTFYYQYHIEYHYSTMIVPVLVVAAASGVARFTTRRGRVGAVVVLAVAALLSAYQWGPHGRHRAFVADPGRPDAVAARRALELIPADAIVSASHPYVPHLTHRRYIYEFPVPWRAANWADFSLEGQTLPFADTVEYLLVTESQLHEEQNEELVAVHLDDFDTIFSDQGILVLRRGRP